MVHRVTKSQTRVKQLLMPQLEAFLLQIRDLALFICRYLPTVSPIFVKCTSKENFESSGYLEMESQYSLSSIKRQP